MDLISRQAAIDKAYELDLSDTGNAIEITVIDVDDIRNLPSAQAETCDYWDSESNYCALNKPSAQSDWNEMLVICDNCGHAIHVKRLQGENDGT